MGDRRYRSGKGGKEALLHTRQFPFIVKLRDEESFPTATHASFAGRVREVAGGR